MDFWSWLVDIGAIQGDPTYYSEGLAGPAEMQHALDTANQWFVGEGHESMYHYLADEGLIQGDPGG